MIRHYLILLFRNFQRFKTTYIINFIGLSSGLCCAMLIFLWIQDEMQFDKFHEKGGQLFQVMSNISSSDAVITSEATPIGMAYVLSQTFPEIENAATVTANHWFPKFILETGTLHLKAEGKFVGEHFFEMFSYDLMTGDRTKVLLDPNSIVISEAIAINLFGSASESIGKSIPWKIVNIDKTCQVTGVFRDVPQNSSENFDVVLPITLLGNIMGFDRDDLGGPGPGTFVLLKKGADIPSLNQKITSFMRSKRKNSENESFFVAPFSEKYLYGKFENGIQTGGRIQYVWLFGIIAVFILLIACINFMNLSTARATMRLKEAGIRKVIGAKRKSLIFQFLGEALVIVSFSFLMALLLVTLLLPDFNRITGKHISMDLNLQSGLALIGVAIITGLVAGSYPAFYISGFSPVQILKGKLRTSSTTLFARKGLVIFQFCVSLILIVAVIVTFLQIDYIQNKNPGYQKENVLYFENEGNIPLNRQSFLGGLKEIPGVLSASGMVGNVVGFGQPRDMDFEGRRIPFNFLLVDYGLIETLNIELLAGRAFSELYNDSSSAVFNEAAIEAMGIEDAVGKVIQFDGAPLTIAGIVKNFHLHSLHKSITPLIIRLEKGQQWNIIVRIANGNEKETIAAIEKFYHRFNPGFSFDYRFLDTDYQRQYLSEQRVASLSRYFAVLGIVISCLGLFGLASFTAERRTKEIGIRKVLGASASGIIYLLSADFLLLVVVACCIALPSSYFLSRAWLNNFAYRIDLDIWIFAFAGLISILIATLAVGGQAFAASHVNPAQCLKDE